MEGDADGSRDKQRRVLRRGVRESELGEERASLRGRIGVRVVAVGSRDEEGPEERFTVSLDYEMGGEECEAERGTIASAAEPDFRRLSNRSVSSVVVHDAMHLCELLPPDPCYLLQYPLLVCLHKMLHVRSPPLAEPLVQQPIRVREGGPFAFEVEAGSSFGGGRSADGGLHAENGSKQGGREVRGG